MSAWNFLSNLVKPVTDLVDNLHTSEEERLEVKGKLFELQTNITSKVLELEAKLLEAKSNVITAEAQGQSWIQRNWRPLTMLTFVGLIVAHWLGFTAENLSEAEVLSLLGLVKIGIGGYITSRGVEKVAPKIVEVMRRD